MLTRTVLAGALTIGSLLSVAVAPSASAAATPPATTPAASTREATTDPAAATQWTLTSVRPGYERQAAACIRLWKPYGQKIKGKWHVVAGGRLRDCGLTYFSVTLQQKRWWGWDNRSSKTITRKGDVNPKVKCKTFGKYSWRTIGTWYRRTNKGFETLAVVTTKSWRTRC
ncbi:hypothetical protein [Actinoplanes sp. NPDC049599]|uniref:hypothetical protein n=1 Tax=Actinoplanes sp. NPDC049599 TaxID=3363903 RepID=UPI0037A643B8